MKDRLLILLLCCICAMSMSARKSRHHRKEHSTSQQAPSLQNLGDSIPLEGLTNLWQFTPEKIVTLVGKNDLSYSKYDKKGAFQVDTLYDGRAACRAIGAIALPWTVNTLPKTITLVAYLYSKKDASKNPTRVLCNDRAFSFGKTSPSWWEGPRHPDSYTGGLFEFDEGDFEMKIELDSVGHLYTLKESPMPQRIDSAGFVYFYMPIAISYDNISHDKKDPRLVDYDFALTIGGKQIRTHRKFNFSYANDKSRDEDYNQLYISAPSGYRMTYLAAYDRLLTDQEMASVMHVDTLDTFTPEQDPTNVNMFHVYYALILFAILIVIYIVHRSHRLSPISHSKSLDSANDSKEAEEEIAKAEEQFMINGKTYYPSGERMNLIREHLGAAKRAGVGPELEERYNRLVKVYNNCNSYVFSGYTNIMMPLMMLIIVLYDMSQFENIEFSLRSKAFYGYYLIAAATFFTGFNNRYKVINGRELDVNNLSISPIPKVLPFIIQIVAATISVIVIPILAYLGIIWLFVALALFLTTSYVIVETGSGAIVGSGVSWGCIPAIIIMVIATPWLMHWGLNILVWCMVWLPPIICLFVNRMEDDEFNNLQRQSRNNQQSMQVDNLVNLPIDTGSQILISSGPGRIIVNRVKKGNKVELYNSDGVLVNQCIASESRVEFNNLVNGMGYIVKTGGQAEVVKL